MSEQNDPSAESWDQEYGNAYRTGHMEGLYITKDEVALWQRWYARGFVAGLKRQRDEKGRFTQKEGKA